MDREQLAEWLSAYLDGELTSKEVELVDRLLREDEEVRRLLDELMRTTALVSSLPRHRAPRSIEEDVRSQLERSDLLSDLGRPRLPSGGRRWLAAGRLAMAAMLGFVVLGALWVVVDRYEPGRRPSAHVALAPEKTKEDLRAPPPEVKPASRGKGSEPRQRAIPGKKAARRRRGSVPGELGPTDEAMITCERLGDRAGRPGTHRAPENVMEVLDVEKKLVAGAAPASLRQHHFANEPLHLQIRVDDEAERDALSARLAAHLAKHRVTNLADYVWPGDAESFYYTGKVGINFENADERQILVRASPRQIEDLVDELGLEETPDDRIVLAVASVPFRGASQTRTMLRRLGRPETAAPGEPAGPDDSDTSMTSSDRGLFAGLFEVVGFTPETFPVVSEAAIDETSEERRTGPTTRVAVAESDGGWVSGADAAKVTPPSTGADEAERAISKDKVAVDRREGGPAPGVSKEEHANLPPEPVSLVERRLRAMKEPRQALTDAQPSELTEESMPTAFGRGYIASRPGAAVLAEEAPEPLLTVVVQLIVETPKERSTTARQVPEPRGESEPDRLRRSKQPDPKTPKPKK